MKILLDHCIDWRLGRSLPSHQIKSSQEMGWECLKNGKLLAAAGASFEVLLTVDQNIKAEQNLSMLPISVMVLIAQSNRLRDLRPGQLIEIRTSGITTIV
jgi:predicted nuclease of predicted toxin-antitoxin system